METPIELSIDDLTWYEHGASGSIFIVNSFQPEISLKHILTNADPHRNIFLTEVQALKRLTHPNIVKYLGIGRFKQKRTNFWAEGILMEFCERGSLCHLLDKPTIIYTIHTVVWWTRQLIDALDYLAKNKVVHRDVKPLNIFVSTYFSLKLGDFGSIKQITQSCSSFTPVGTRRYMSPEQSKSICGKKLSYRSDVYSMGLVIWEMIERRKVFAQFGSHYDYGLLSSNEKQLIDVETFVCDHEIRYIVEKCTVFDVDQRSRASELMIEIEAIYKQNEADIAINARPIENQTETRLIKPIGFDRTERKISVCYNDILNGIGIVGHTSTGSTNKSPIQEASPMQSAETESMQLKLLETVEQILEENKEIRKALQCVEVQQQRIGQLELNVDLLQTQERETRRKVASYEQAYYKGMLGAPSNDSGYVGTSTTTSFAHAGPRVIAEPLKEENSSTPSYATVYSSRRSSRDSLRSGGSIAKPERVALNPYENTYSDAIDPVSSRSTSFSILPRSPTPPAPPLPVFLKEKSKAKLLFERFWKAF